MITPSYVRTMARCNSEMNRRVYAAAAPLTDEQRKADRGLFWKSLHGTLNHLLVGEHHLWFVRFAEGISPKVALDAELESGRAQLDARLRDWAADPAIACVVLHGAGDKAFSAGGDVKTLARAVAAAA